MQKLLYLHKLLGELWRFARLHRAYWIVPLVLVLLLALVVVTAGSSSLPYLYTVF